MKPPTTQGVGACLKKAGHTRSVYKNRRVTRWPEWTEGYQVAKGYPSGVQVEYRPHALNARHATDEKRRAEAEKYVQTLTEAGYTVEHDDTWAGRLFVTGRMDDKES